MNLDDLSGSHECIRMIHIITRDSYQSSTRWIVTQQTNNKADVDLFLGNFMCCFPLENLLNLMGETFDCFVETLLNWM